MPLRQETIAGKYEPGMCGVDNQQFGCSVSTDNWVDGISTDYVVMCYFMDIRLSQCTCEIYLSERVFILLQKYASWEKYRETFCKKKKKNLVSAVPCRRTVYRMVGDAESRAYCWSKYEIQNLWFSQMRHGLHQTGTCTGSIAATGVTKVCLQFLDFLYVTLTSRPGLQGPHFWGLCLRQKQIPAFDVSLTMHLSITLATDQLDAQIFNTFITILYMYMFQAISCSSSGGQIVLTQYMVSSLSVGDRPVHWLRKKEFFLNLCTGRSLTDSDDTRCCINTIWPPEDEQDIAGNMCM